MQKIAKQLVLEKYPKAKCRTCFTGGVMWLLPEADAKFQVELEEPFTGVHTLCSPGHTANIAWTLAWYAISGEWVRSEFGARRSP